MEKPTNVERGKFKIQVESGVLLTTLCWAIEQTMAGDGMPGGQGNGSLCENKETLPGRPRQTRSRPRPRAAALPLIPVPQLPPPTSHVPHHQLPPLASHSATTCGALQLARTSFTRDRRFPTASLSGAQLAGPCQVTGTGGGGFSWRRGQRRLFRRCHRNHCQWLFPTMLALRKQAFSLRTYNLSIQIQNSSKFCTQATHVSEETWFCTFS